MLSKCKSLIIFLLLALCTYVFADIISPDIPPQPNNSYLFLLSEMVAPFCMYNELLSMGAPNTLHKLIPYLFFGWGILLYALAFTMIVRQPQDFTPPEKPSRSELLLTVSLPCLSVLILVLSDNFLSYLPGMLTCLFIACLTNLAWIFLKQPHFCSFRSSLSWHLFAEACTILSAYLMYDCLLWISCVPGVLYSNLRIRGEYGPDPSSSSFLLKFLSLPLLLLLFVLIPFIPFIFLRISLYLNKTSKRRSVLLKISLVSFLLMSLLYGAFLFQINFFF